MLLVGVLVAGRSTSMGDFAVTGRNMSLAVCFVSIVATWFGAGPMMGSAAAQSERAMASRTEQVAQNSLPLFRKAD